jgi:hypothetical protein
MPLDMEERPRRLRSVAAPCHAGPLSGAPSPGSAILLTVCSQTVRMPLDVAAHVHSKCAGQAHNGGRGQTSQDELVGFNPGI